MRAWFALLLILGACSSAPKSQAPVQVEDSEYKALIKANTRSTDQYEGFLQTFQASATLITTDVANAILKRRAEYLQWDAAKLQQERDHMFQSMSGSTRVVLRFFSPESDYDDLHRANTIWKVYLEQGGRRFEGKVRKMSEKLVELIHLYPHFDRFSSPYEVTFNVPTSASESSTVKFILTSSLGNTEFTFNGK